MVKSEVWLISSHIIQPLNTYLVLTDVLNIDSKKSIRTGLTIGQDLV